MSFRLPTFGFFLLLLLTACGQLKSPTVPDLSPAATAGGTVVAWGLNNYGQTNVPALPEGVSYTSVDGGFEHSLALRSDGQVVAWGQNNVDQTNVPALPEGMSYAAVAAGYAHSLAVRSDGQVVAWGFDSYGQTNVPALPAGVTYTAVAAGDYHSLAMRSDGQIVAWGYNINRQTNIPALSEGSKYIGVAAGGNHSLAIIQTSKQSQTLDFTSQAPTDATVGGSYTPTATAMSGLSVTFATTPPGTCTLSGGTVSFVAAGECTVTADQAGNGTYNPAPQISQSFTISLPPTVGSYTLDFERTPLNQLINSVKLGTGIVYQGSGTPSSATVPIVAKRRLDNKILEGHQGKVVSLYGSKRLTIVKAGTNTPNALGGRIKLSFTNINPAGATLTSLTLSNLTSRGAYLTFYYVNGSASRQDLGTTTRGGNLVVPLDINGLRAVDIYAPNAYTVDNVKFEVPVPN